jgi:hypothetical protein
MARSPAGRIKEICRNGNTLVMFMEASNLTPEEKLKVLKEFDKSFFEIFGLLDFKKSENIQRFQESLFVFRQFVWERLGEIDEKHTERQEAIKEFDNCLGMLPQCLENPSAVIEKLKDLDKAVPNFCLDMGLGDRQTARVMDEFAFFLFNVSEVKWIADEGIRKIISFQAVVRRYKEKITKGNWEPELAKIIDDLARYAQGCESVLPPIVRFSRLPDIPELLSKAPFIHRWYDDYFKRKKRKLVACLLPRVAMLPIEHIYWLEGNEVKGIDRAMVESEIGGLSVKNLSGRVVLRIHPPLGWFGLRNIKAAFAQSLPRCSD